MTYPSYPPQPYTGRPFTMAEAGTADSRASSGTAPHFQAAIDSLYSRQLAGGETVQDEASDMEQGPEKAWAGRELTTMAKLDDVQGSGIFDPPGSHPNIWPDAGVFAVAYSLPGYHARERMFAPSEVVDSTTGRPIIAVPSGAVPLDPAAQIAWVEKARYAPPTPVVRANAEYPVAFESTANVMQNPIPVGALAADDEVPGPVVAETGKRNVFLVALGVGVAAGVAYAVLSKSKKRKRSR